MRRFYVTIQRTELLTITEHVGEWEIPVLQLVHGAERVAVGTFTKDAQPYPAAAAEYERLERRYRENPATGATRVAEVYGAAPGGIRILWQAIKEAATEQNTPEAMSGEIALSDELNEEILPPTEEVTAVEEKGTPATPDPIVAPKPSVPKPAAKKTAAAAPKKQLIPKGTQQKAAVVPTPAQPTDPIKAAGQADPLAIDE